MAQKSQSCSSHTTQARLSFWRQPTGFPPRQPLRLVSSPAASLWYGNQGGNGILRDPAKIHRRRLLRKPVGPTSRLAGQPTGAVVAQRGVLVGSGDKPHAMLDVLDDPRVLLGSCLNPRRSTQKFAGAHQEGWEGGWMGGGGGRGCSSSKTSRRQTVATYRNTQARLAVFGT